MQGSALAMIYLDLQIYMDIHGYPQVKTAHTMDSQVCIQACRHALGLRPPAAERVHPAHALGEHPLVPRAPPAGARLAQLLA